MTYNTIMDKILVDLKVLSKINQNGKLSTCNNTIHIENSKFYTPFIRYLYGDSRAKTVEKIQELINNSQQVSISILQHSCMNIYQRNNEPASIEIVEFNKNYQQLKLLSNELKNSIQGINNLLTTYKDDANICSKLEVIVDNIKRLVIEIESNLEEKTKRKPRALNINNESQNITVPNNSYNNTDMLIQQNKLNSEINRSLMSVKMDILNENINDEKNDLQKYISQNSPKNNTEAYTEDFEDEDNQ